MIPCLFKLATWTAWMIVYFYFYYAHCSGSLSTIMDCVESPVKGRLLFAICIAHCLGSLSTLVTPLYSPAMCEPYSVCPSSRAAIKPLWWLTGRAHCIMIPCLFKLATWTAWMIVYFYFYIYIYQWRLRGSGYSGSARVVAPLSIYLKPARNIPKHFCSNLLFYREYNFVSTT